MAPTEGPPRTRHPLFWIALALLALALAGGFSRPAAAQISHPDQQQAWLVTYGPGDTYWQRFGHNAIWLRDPRTGLDDTFNFGYFDFEQERFLTRFVQGRMLYFSMAQPAVQEFVQYRGEGRSIRLQRLALSRTEFARLRDHLTNAVKPENREYRYDYYLDNCSTRVRDAIDLALGGKLKRWASQQPADQTFRDHTRRLTRPQGWLYLGTEVPLGRVIDRPITRWDEFFIPEMLSAALQEYTETGIGTVVLEDQLLHPSSIPAPADTPEPVWQWFAGLAAVLGLLAWLVSRNDLQRGDRLTAAWLILTAAIGSFLLFAWFLTDHWAANENANVLLLNPIWLLGLVPGLKRPVGLLMLAGIGGAAWYQWQPGGQYLLDALVLFGPLNAMAAWWLLRYGGGGEKAIQPSNMPDYRVGNPEKARIR